MALLKMFAGRKAIIIHSLHLHIVSYVMIWCLTPLSTLCQLHLAVSFISGGNRSTQIKPPQVTDKLYHIMLYRVHLVINGTRIHNFSGDIH